jgi:hypothetical protein
VDKTIEMKTDLEWKYIKLVNQNKNVLLSKMKGRVIPVTDRGSPQGCEMSRLPHFVDSSLIDAVRMSALHASWPSFNSRKISVTHFC